MEKSTFKILFYIRKNRLNREKKSDIMVRITVNGEIAQFNTKYAIEPELWDTKMGKAVGKARQTTNFNLDKVKASIINSYHKILEKDSYVTAEKIKNTVLGINFSGTETLLGAFKRHNDNLVEQLGKGVTKETVGKYERTKNRLEEFMRCKYKISDINLKEINFSFINDFEIFLKTVHDCNQNTASKFLQRFKRIITISKNDGILQVDPFNKIRFKHEKTNRAYLTEQEIESILSKNISVKRLAQVRDFFVFSCFTGLSYIDMCNLTKRNIGKSFDGNTWILGERHKTNVSYKVPLLDIPKRIIEKYETDCSDKVFPIISNEKMNAYLKEIATICGIDKNLTFHVARHSFATLMLSKGASIESVSKMLGHTDIKTTQIYAKITDNKIGYDMAICADKLKGLENRFADYQKQNNTILWKEAK